MPLFSDTVAFFSSVVVLTINGQLLDCANTVFGQQCGESSVLRKHHNKTPREFLILIIIIIIIIIITITTTTTTKHW